MNSIEIIKPEFWDDDAKIPQPYKIYRFNASGSRYYFTWEDKNFEPKVYQSVTSVIKNHIGSDKKHLYRWYGQKGYSFCIRYLGDAAIYGTFMHIQINKMFMDKKYDLSKIHEYTEQFLVENNINPISYSILEEDDEDTFINVFSKRLKNDLMAFMQFCVDVNFQPIASELALCSPKGYAGAIDLVGYMDIDVKQFNGEYYKSGEKKGLPKETIQKKRVLSIVDFKSGRKGFYKDHEWQLKLYQNMWNENFPLHIVERTFNWSPNDWTKSPTYKLKDQTEAVRDNVFFKFLEYYSEIAKDNVPYLKEIDETVVNFKENVFSGDNSIIHRRSLIDAIKERFSEEDTATKILTESEKFQLDEDIESLF